MLFIVTVVKAAKNWSPTSGDDTASPNVPAAAVGAAMTTLPLPPLPHYDASNMLKEAMYHLHKRVADLENRTDGLPAVAPSRRPRDDNVSTRGVAAYACRLDAFFFRVMRTIYRPQKCYNNNLIETFRYKLHRNLARGSRLERVNHNTVY
jgi:hypothetical protein